MKYPDADLQNYWSPAQVRLYIDEVWLDDACAVRYVVQDDRTPKYGYFDRTFRAVARGRTIVSGELSINFRFNGYLRGAIQNAIQRRRDTDYLLDPGCRFRKQSPNFEEVIQMGTADQLARLSLAAQSIQEDRDSWFQKYKDEYWGGNARYPSTVRPERTRQQAYDEAYDRPSLTQQGFNIVIVFGTDTVGQRDPALTRVIQDVHLTNEMTTAEIEVPDGGRAIREVYRFLAKDVRSGNGRPAPPEGGATSGAQ